MDKGEAKSLYIHIPFCHSICSYCDFCKMFYNEKLVSSYLNSLRNEISKYYQNEIIETIYIGGGTPSSLNCKQLDILFDILKVIKTSSNLEFTFEVNVNDINESLLKKLKNNKVNRISIGIETINDKFLKLIERYHTKEEVLEKINLTKNYFDNINVDFMYGFPEETMEDLNNDLEFFKELDVNHISIYSLILEPNTKLYINNIEPIDENLESNMYFHIIDYLEKLGFNHYEISNFEKNGTYSRHNLTYWNNEHYYGFGLGASGYINNIRYTDTRSINKYLNGSYRLEADIITKELDMENEMILGLRKIKGVSKTGFLDKFKCRVEDVFDINKLLHKNLLQEDKNYLFIPKDKLYLSNSILVNFIKND
ncbi:MAG: radical SAM family heme chaperone HemW [Bacilli bacterium]|nr:radical SAM family heme chaperone HemW [Bacilli bacterium]